MTEEEAQEIVRKRYPAAACRKIGRWSRYKIFAAPGRQIGGKTPVGCERDTEKEAWKNAAERISREGAS